MQKEHRKRKCHITLSSLCLLWSACSPHSTLERSRAVTLYWHLNQWYAVIRLAFRQYVAQRMYDSAAQLQHTATLLFTPTEWQTRCDTSPFSSHSLISGSCKLFKNEICVSNSVQQRSTENKRNSIPPWPIYSRWDTTDKTSHPSCKRKPPFNDLALNSVQQYFIEFFHLGFISATCTCIKKSQPNFILANLYIYAKFRQTPVPIKFSHGRIKTIYLESNKKIFDHIISMF